jgi:drug/metabolite transporter (DMT)-like permease
MTGLPDRSKLAVGALLIAGLLWGLSWLPLKHFGNQGLSGITLSMVCYGLISAGALPWLVWRRAAWWQQRWLVLTIAITGGAANVSFLSALLAGEVVRVMLLFYLAPVWGVLGARLFLREDITPLRLTAVILAVLGAVLILGGPGALTSPIAAVDLVAVASGALYAAQNIATRAADRTPLDAKTLVVFAGCAMLAAAIVLATDQTLPPMPPALLAQIAVFGGVWIMAAVAITAWGVTHLEAGRASVLLVFELVVAALSAMWIGGERLDGIEWIGAAFITGAALLEARTPPVPVKS